MTKPNDPVPQCLEIEQAKVFMDQLRTLAGSNRSRFSRLAPLLVGDDPTFFLQKLQALVTAGVLSYTAEDGFKVTNKIRPNENQPYQNAPRPVSPIPQRTGVECPFCHLDTSCHVIDCVYAGKLMLELKPR